MKFSEQDLDMTNSRIVELEKNIAILQVAFEVLNDQLKQTQGFLVKLANNQAEITKRVTKWPYIGVYREEE